MNNRHVDYLQAIFSNITLKVRSKISAEVEDMFNNELQETQVYHVEPRVEDLERALIVLEDELRKAIKASNSAKRKFKKNFIPIEELQDHEMYVNELQAQIENIKSKLF